MCNYAYSFHVFCSTHFPRASHCLVIFCASNVVYGIPLPCYYLILCVNNVSLTSNHWLFYEARRKRKTAVCKQSVAPCGAVHYTVNLELKFTVLHVDGGNLKVSRPLRCSWLLCMIPRTRYHCSFNDWCWVSTLGSTRVRTKHTISHGPLDAGSPRSSAPYIIQFMRGSMLTFPVVGGRGCSPSICHRSGASSDEGYAVLRVVRYFVKCILLFHLLSGVS